MWGLLGKISTVKIGETADEIIIGGTSSGLPRDGFAAGPVIGNRTL